MSIILTKYKKEQIRKNNCIGEGNFAKLYDYNGKVIKLFDDTLESEVANNIKNLPKDKIDFFVFPEELVKDIFRFLIGYTEEKINGYTLKELFDLLLNDQHLDISINDFMFAYEKLKPSIKEVSERYYYMTDTHDENIMYDTNLNFIDFDYYWQDETALKSAIYTQNMNSVGLALVDSIRKLNEDFTFKLKKTIKLYDPDYFDKFIDNLDKKYGDIDTLIKYKNYKI